MALYNYKGPLVPGLNFVKNSLTHFYSLFISSSTLHLIAERLASVAADTNFIVFGLTRLRIEPSLPAFSQEFTDAFLFSVHFILHATFNC